MLSLVANVFEHPIQPARAKAHHTVASLPFEHFLAAELLVHIVRRAALELADELADQQRRRKSRQSRSSSLPNRRRVSFAASTSQCRSRMRS